MNESQEQERDAASTEPLLVANAPGRRALRARIGTRSTFFDSMVRQLAHWRPEHSGHRLLTRDPADPALALLDAWATAADLLTFYTERWANEGYLATATERTSLFELARLVGFQPSPGVAASVLLAYTIEDGLQTTIPRGSAVRSVPGENELAQTFETSAELSACAEFNTLRARLTAPQQITPDNVASVQCIYLAGSSLGLKPSDEILISLPDAEPQARQIAAVVADPLANRTKVWLVDGPAEADEIAEPADAEPADAEPADAEPADAGNVSVAHGGIGLALDSREPLNRVALVRNANESLHTVAGAAADVMAQLADALALAPREQLQSKWRTIRLDPSEVRITLLSAPLQLFGHNAPRQVFKSNLEIENEVADWNIKAADFAGKLHVAAETTALAPGYVRIRQDDDAESKTMPVALARVVARSDYGLNGKVTELTLDDVADWRNAPDEKITRLRTTIVRVETAALQLAEAPIESPIGPASTDRGDLLPPDFDPEIDEIELDDIYLGLEPGRWLTIQGQRADVPKLTAVESNRIRYIKHVLRDYPGERPCTRIVLAERLAWSYARDSLEISANVAPATHGQSITQVLGSGDSSQILQHFDLAASPLTWLACPTSTGISSTLAVSVDGIRWQQRPTLENASPTSRQYMLVSSDHSITSVQFGDGITGARLPTGNQNVVAEYRVGLGTPGNVKADTITQLAVRPLGVKAVTNPLPAAGGIDGDNIEQIRARAPSAVMALKRLVCVADYASFARCYSGVAKAVARRLFIAGNGHVHVTIAASSDVPIGQTSELVLRLQEALLRRGDPQRRVRVSACEPRALFLGIRVRLASGQAWSLVEPALRQSLYQHFGFDGRDLGSNLHFSEVQSVIGSVEGIVDATIEVFEAVGQHEFARFLDGAENSYQHDPLERLANAVGAPAPVIHARLARVEEGQVLPAQIVYLDPMIPDSLFLRELTP